MRVVLFAILLTATASGQTTQAPPEEQKPSQANKRVELNLLGLEDASAGESRRNENVQFNLVDNNALKELNVRLGATATIISEFRPEYGYFSAEFGNAPSSLIHISSAARRPWHGNIYASHLNSVLSARSFFQVGDVRPARENDYGFSIAVPLTKSLLLSADASQQRLRGNVNGNVLVPKADERTPLATDPATRDIVARYLAAYPATLPNRTDINERALNTNAPQSIDNNNGSLRLDSAPSARDGVYLLYSLTSQAVDAFQLVAGQNPDTDTRSHRARITWQRECKTTTIAELSAGFDRVGSLLLPEPNAVGPLVNISGLTALGPSGVIPIDRAHNIFRYVGSLRGTSAAHAWSAGFGILRRQLNGIETDAHRGFFSFANDFGRDAITNLRLGAATQHIVSIGDVNRGVRNFEWLLYAGDRWRLKDTTTIDVGLRFQPVSAPYEVNGRNTIPYDCDCNNFAPTFGLAQRLPGRCGIIRAAYGLHYGEIFPVTFQQVRFSPPGSVKIVVPTPYLPDPLAGNPDALGNLYLLDPELATPYSHQYNFVWEPDIAKSWKLQLGYVGSRSHKLLIMWYLNRAHPVPGIPLTTATVNQRRPDPTLADKRFVVNSSRGYFDAARISFILPRWRGLSTEVAYWFSKALDLGAGYTNTAYDNDSRAARSQWEYETHRDMRGRSSFDQPHAFLWRVSYSTPSRNGGSPLVKLWRDWIVSAVVLRKSGTPFNVQSGSDGPGFGNVDGNGSDRPNLLDPSVLGRTIGHPDTSRRLLPRESFAFIVPGAGMGNLGFNTFRKGRIANVNASVSRSFPAGNSRRIMLRAESVNAFNTPQFAEPGFELANPNFGYITNTLNDGRTFRFLLQFTW